MSQFDFDPADVSRSGVYQTRNADLDTFAALARDGGLRVLRVDLEDCRDKRTLLMRLSIQLDFPADRGRNWDALSDALRDLSWLPATNGYTLLLEAGDDLREAAPADLGTLLDILDEAAAAWRAAGLPFLAFIGLDRTPDQDD